MLERKFKSEKSIKRQSHKMVKHIECVWPFRGIGAKRVKLKEMWEGCKTVTFKFFLIIKNYKYGAGNMTPHLFRHWVRDC